MQSRSCGSRPSTVPARLEDDLYLPADAGVLTRLRVA